jgi:hypothetical protein
MKSDEKKQKKKQPYEKPRLRTIELAAEEVLATGCKTLSSGPTNFGGQPFCGISSSCVLDGS